MPRCPAVCVLALALLALTAPRSVWAQESVAAEPAATEPATPADEPIAPGAETGEAAEEEDLFLKTLPLDIASADFYALVAWVRSLGLSETGGAEELRKRLYGHYGVVAPPPAASSSRTITIESADRTEYLSATADSEATVRFAGRVSIVIKDDESGEVISLQADEVLLNRDASILSARGGVVFERKRPDATDYFIGELLELDLDDQSGLFLDGSSERGTGQDALTFKADEIVSKGAGVLVFKDGVISSCDDGNPHYSIRASKVWILGGNEWAMLNATLSVGEVPMLYLPFFYYPGEEIAFHPVFGYRDREGRFVQTTTYLLGERPSKREEISLFRLTEGTKAEDREIRGVFLRSTGEAKKDAGTDFLKVMADIYTGLGVFAGAQAKLATLGSFNGVDAFLGLGFSRSIFLLPNGAYSPFADASGYESVWHKTWFAGAALPLRYALELSSRLSVGALGVNFSLPFYGDPFFDQDFRNRSENMAWLKFLKQDEEASPPGKRTSFTDRVEIQLAIPSAILPRWISSLSLSRLTTSLTWASKVKTPIPAADPDKTLYNADPSREFFYPDQLVIMDGALNLAGTLFKWPASKASAKASGSTGGEAAGDWPVPGPSPPWGTEKPAAQAKLSGEAGVLPGELPGILPGFVPPELALAPALSSPQGLTMSLAWQLSPSVRWDNRFLGASWTEPGDIDWRTLYELRSLKAAGSMSFSADAASGALGLKLGLSGSTQRQDRSNVSADTAYVSAALADSWALQDAQFRNDRLGASFQLRATPFMSSWLFAPTSFSWSIDASLYEYAFAAMGAGGIPEYETRTLEWTKERIKAHSLALSLAARPGGLTQTLSFQASLPPLLDSYSGRLSLQAAFGSLSASTRYARSAEGAALAWDPLTVALSVGKSPWPTLGSTFIWNLEDGRASSLATRASWMGLSGELNFRRATPLELVIGTGWQPSGAESFMATDFSLGYQKEWKPAPAWKDRLAWSLSLGTSVRQSFVRFTDSILDFNLSFTFKVNEFLDLQLSSTSRNAALWRYFPGAFDLPSGVSIVPVNPALDLLKSFNFFDSDESDRMESLFKLKSVSFKAIHYLHDWDLSLDVAVRPVLNQDSLSYDFRTTLTLLLAWKGVPEIKSAYKADGDTETWD